MQYLRSHIGVVSQEPVLFEGSISENIKMGKIDATDEEVEEAAQIANAHSFVLELPDVTTFAALILPSIQIFVFLIMTTLVLLANQLKFYVII